MSSIWEFDSIKNKRSLYRGEYCTKRFCISLGEHATDLINFENKKMLMLTEKTLKSQQDAVPCSICGQKFT